MVTRAVCGLREQGGTSEGGGVQVDTLLWVPAEREKDQTPRPSVGLRCVDIIYSILMTSVSRLSDMYY